MMNKKPVSPLMMRTRAAGASVLSSLVCIVIGLILGYLFLLLLNAEHAWEDGLLPIIKGGFKSFGNKALEATKAHMKPLGMEIAEAAPLIMTGLSVAFAFKTGLFNIGASGQYTVGAFCALACAIVFQLPWWVCLLASFIAGAIWGFFPGLFKSLFNVNEVITSIMFNWIGLYGVNTIMYGGGNSIMFSTNDSKTFRLDVISPQSKIPDLSGLGSR